ncbi:MAG TPA: hypothetical protein PLO24_02870 [Bacteroidales bacterium]|nr:hypothetical protein [Bacteroidales bacterium]HOS71398.1 hypothetical protein [Bacteroidales bacterium]HQH24758.1 hypothetical protein [Bacteroidales bacterium]HQJ82935.1 hypothetical protein [Bacteroidales bacterium]
MKTLKILTRLLTGMLFVHKNAEHKAIVEKTKNFLPGFYSPFGLKLLSTIDFIITEKNIETPEAITKELANWSNRKKTMFTNPNFIQIATKNIKQHNLPTANKGLA